MSSAAPVDHAPSHAAAAATPSDDGWSALLDWVRGRLAALAAGATSAQPPPAQRCQGPWRILARHDGRLLGLMAFLAAVEVDHACAIAVATLQRQGGSGDARPGVHLAQRVSGDDNGAALALAVDLALVERLGDGPAVLAALRLTPAVQDLLLHGRIPGVVLPTASAALVPLALNAPLAAAAAQLARVPAGVLAISGRPGSGRRGAAAALAAQWGRRARLLPATAWERRDQLAAAGLTSEVPVLLLDDIPPERYPGGIVTPPGPRAAPLLLLLPATARAPAGAAVLAMPAADAAERRDWWQRLLPHSPAALAHAGLGPGAVAEIAADALQRAAGAPPNAAQLHAAHAAWAARALQGFAQPVNLAAPLADEDLVLHPDDRQALRTALARCQRRDALWRGLGGTALATATRRVVLCLAGESGTGKTLAAAWLAHRLGLPLLRLDLALIMDKYVGESEKRISGALDAADAADGILLIDEADSLLGRRSDGQGPGERFANLLTNHLLGRLEQHGGIVVLTTNARSRLDGAFARRIDVCLDLQGPGPAERLALWRAHLGCRAPADACLDQLAAHVDLSGGLVRSAALAAAAACSGDGPVTPRALAEAVGAVLRPHGRSLPWAVAAWAAETVP